VGRIAIACYRPKPGREDAPELPEAGDRYANFDPLDL